MLSVTTRADRIRALASPFWERLRSVDSRIWLVGALLVATATRLPALGQQSLWVDEGNTHIRAVLPLRGVLEDLMRGRNQAPLYYLLMRPWVSIFGESEFVLRLPSVFVGVLSIAAFYRLGRLSRQCGVGVWAAWIVAVNPFHVWYSRDARTYALTMLLVTVVVWCFLRALHKGGWQCWIALGVMSSLAYLSHYAVLAIGLVQFFVFLVTLRRMYRPFRKWYAVQVAAVVPVASWMIAPVILYSHSGIRCHWIPAPSVLAPLGTLWNFSLGYDGQFSLWVAVGLLLFSGACVAGAWAKVWGIWRRSVLLWLVLPPSVALILSLVFGPSYVDRYLSVCLPAFVLLVAAGLTELPGPGPRAALGVPLLIAMSVSTFGILSGERFPKADWRDAAAQVRSGARDGDRLLVDIGALGVTAYYVDNTLPIEQVGLQTTEAALNDAFHQGGRIWFLHRDPFESIHTLDRVRRFDPYVSGEPHIARWLEDHRDQIRREWCLRGVYLALLE